MHLLRYRNALARIRPVDHLSSLNQSFILMDDLITAVATLLFHLECKKGRNGRGGRYDTSDLLSA